MAQRDGEADLGPVAKAALELYREHQYGAERFSDVKARQSEPPDWWLDLAPGTRLILEDRTRRLHPQLHPVSVSSIGEPYAEVSTPTGKHFTISWWDYHYRLFAFDSKAWGVLEDTWRKVRALKRERRRTLFQDEIERLEAEITDISRQQREIMAELKDLLD